VLIIADLAQIEARILLWLVRDKMALAAIASGASIYEVHAVRSMKYDPSRGKLKEVDPSLYALAKARVLGAGYGCGAGTFQKVAKTLAGLDLTMKECTNTVTDFRTSNPKIVRLWRDLQRDCAWSRGENFTMELPSGRNLNYYGVRYGAGRELTAAWYRDGSRRVKLFGGKLTDNLVQAVARDAFVEGLVDLDREGLPVLFHTHDEAVLEVDEKDAPEAMQFVNRILSKNPEWMPDCPLETEVFQSTKYMK